MERLRSQIWPAWMSASVPEASRIWHWLVVSSTMQVGQVGEGRVVGEYVLPTLLHEDDTNGMVLNSSRIWATTLNHPQG
jgi:hypothetical protein